MEWSYVYDYRLLTQNLLQVFLFELFYGLRKLALDWSFGLTASWRPNFIEPIFGAVLHKCDIPGIGCESISLSLEPAKWAGLLGSGVESIFTLGNDEYFHSNIYKLRYLH